MEPLPLSPEQKAKIKKAKLILWLGLGAIMLIGFVVVFYFVLTNKAVAPVVNNATNSNLNASVASNTNSTVDTSDWQTFSSSTAWKTEDLNGFSPDYENTLSYQIQYPRNWSLDGTVFDDENGHKIAEFLPGAFYLKDGQNCTDKPLPDPNGWPSEELSRENIKIGDLSGVKIITKTAVESPNMSYWYPNMYCLQSGNKAFQMFFYETELGTGDRTLFEKILSTLKFLPDTSDWLTYENKEYGFQMEYPSSYTLQDNQRSPYLYMAYFEYPGFELSRGCSISVMETHISEFINGVLAYGVTDEGSTTINGLEWRFLSYDPKNDPTATDQSKGHTYLIEKNNKTYKFGCDINVSSSATTSEVINSNVEKIIASLRFLPDTSDWLTYNSSLSSLEIFKNLNPAFTLKFPKDWKSDESLAGLTISDVATNGTAPYIQMSISDEPMSGDLIENCKKRSGWGNPTTPIPDFVKFDKEERLTVDSINSVLVSFMLEGHPNTDANMDIVCVPLETKSFIVWAEPRDSELVKNYLIPVLSTLKFISR